MIHDPVPIIDCGDEFSSCRCCLSADHEPPHVCSCLGSWIDDRVIAFPDIMDIGPVQPRPVRSES